MSKTSQVLYPVPRPNITVKNGHETIEELKKGKSIARFGDGEFQLIFLSGWRYLLERLRGRNPKVFDNGGFWFSVRLKQVLQSNHSNLMIGIPEVFYEGSEKIWQARFYYDHMQQIAALLNPDQAYYAQMFYRYNKRLPDCDSLEERLKAIWQDKHIGIVNFNPKIVESPIFSNASKIDFVQCRRRNSWGRWGRYYQDLLKRCLATECDMILASVGPVACLLAMDLSKNGRQCIDIGQVVVKSPKLSTESAKSFY